uniref:Major facilitator superfamily MFS_1 n=1 Tax=Caulobacter sp. (strain K31) TaxID=366602 RepID=B0T5L6_CAUSK
MTASQTRRRLPLQVYLLALVTFALGSGTFIFAGQLEQLAAGLGIQVGTAGQLQTVYVLSAALCGPVVISLVARRPAKVVLASVLGLALVLNLACWISRGFGSMMMFRAVLGATAAVGGPTAAALAAALVPPEQRGSALATVIGGMTFAFIAGIPAGSVVGDLYGWRATFALAAGLAGVALVGLSLVKADVAAPSAPEPGASSLKTVLTLYPVFATTILMFAASMASSTYVGPILRLQTGITGAGVGVFQALGGIGSLIGLAIGARVANAGHGRAGAAIALGVTCLVALVSFTELHGGAPPGAPTYIVIGLAGLAGSGALFAIIPIIQARIVSAAPHATPLALSFNASSTSLGQGMGAAIGGAVIGRFGVPSAPIATGVIALLAMSVWLLLVGPPRTGAA